MTSTSSTLTQAAFAGVAAFLLDVLYEVWCERTKCSRLLEASRQTQEFVEVSLPCFKAAVLKKDSSYALAQGCHKWPAALSAPSLMPRIRVLSVDLSSFIGRMHEDAWSVCDYVCALLFLHCPHIAVLSGIKDASYNLPQLKRTIESEHFRRQMREKHGSDDSDSAFEYRIVCATALLLPMAGALTIYRLDKLNLIRSQNLIDDVDTVVKSTVGSVGKGQHCELHEFELRSEAKNQLFVVNCALTKPSASDSEYSSQVSADCNSTAVLSHVCDSIEKLVSAECDSVTSVSAENGTHEEDDDDKHECEDSISKKARTGLKKCAVEYNSGSVRRVPMLLVVSCEDCTPHSRRYRVVTDRKDAALLGMSRSSAKQSDTSTWADVPSVIRWKSSYECAAGALPKDTCVDSRRSHHVFSSDGFRILSYLHKPLSQLSTEELALLKQTSTENLFAKVRRLSPFAARNTAQTATHSVGVGGRRAVEPLLASGYPLAFDFEFMFSEKDTIALVGELAQVTAFEEK